MEDLIAKTERTAKRICWAGIVVACGLFFILMLTVSPHKGVNKPLETAGVILFLLLLLALSWSCTVFSIAVLEASLPDMPAGGKNPPTEADAQRATAALKGMVRLVNLAALNVCVNATLAAGIVSLLFPHRFGWIACVSIPGILLVSTTRHFAEVRARLASLTAASADGG